MSKAYLVYPFADADNSIQIEALWAKIPLCSKGLVYPEEFKK
jgi:hypothetical protein